MEQVRPVKKPYTNKYNVTCGYHQQLSTAGAYSDTHMVIHSVDVHTVHDEVLLNCCDVSAATL
jgi:hypothetical protein